MLRTKTGITGFDTLIDGGFPDQANILIQGSPGTGKTVFALNFICKGALLHKEKGLYVSFEQTAEDLTDQAREFSWDIDSLITKRKVEILHFNILDATKNVLDVIIERCKANGIKRLVIDNIPFMLMSQSFISNESGKYSFLYNGRVVECSTHQQLLYHVVKILENTGTTTIFVDKSTTPGSAIEHSIAEYACDGICVLRSKVIGKTQMRYITVSKLRKSNIIGGIFPFTITPNGLEIENGAG